MKIAGHYDGKVVVLDEPVSLPTGTRVEVSVSSPAVQGPLERDAVSGLCFRPGSATALAVALQELARDKENPWLDVGEKFAAELRDRNNRSRHSW